MATKSNIGWTDYTWNPWWGCHKVSQDCKFCYFHRIEEGKGRDPDLIRLHYMQFPRRLKHPSLIFTCSMSDFFIEEADAWRDQAWGIIRSTPHRYQTLTKRPERIPSYLPQGFENNTNVAIGVSIANEDEADRIAHLNGLPCLPFVSFEPLIGPIKWHEEYNFLDWIIIGGESGNESGKYKYRPMEVQWAEYLIWEAKKARIPVFIKQMGIHQARELKLRLKKGEDMNEFTDSLRVQEHPDWSAYRERKVRLRKQMAILT